MTDKPLKDDLLDDLPTPAGSDANGPESKSAATSEQNPGANAAASGVPKLGLWLAGIALVLSLGLMAGGIWLWTQYQTLLDTQQAVASRSSEGLNALGRDLAGLTTRIDAEVVARVEQLRDEQQVMEQSQSRLRDSVNEVKAIAVGDRKPVVLAETEYLLKLANERLTFLFDADTAITALRSADAGLASLEDPQLTDIRAQIAREISALQAVPHPDISGMAVRIANLAELVDDLPLPGRDALRGADTNATTAPEATRERGWREAADKVVDDLRKLVVVRHRGRDQREVLTPRESYFLRENLRLKLESARLALLQREPTTFRDDLDTARTWVTRYFVADSDKVRHMLARLGELASARIEVERPNIAGSLRQVRVLRAQLLGAEAGRAKALAERAASTPEAAASAPMAREPLQEPAR